MEVVGQLGVKANVDGKQGGQLVFHLYDHVRAIRVIDPGHGVLAAEPSPLHATVPAVLDAHFSPGRRHFDADSSA